MRITGRPYQELKYVHCFECDKEARILQREYSFLSWCSYVECRVLLCSTCKSTHEAMHALAGDETASEYWEKIIRGKLYA